MHYETNSREEILSECYLSKSMPLLRSGNDPFTVCYDGTGAASGTASGAGSGAASGSGDSSAVASSENDDDGQHRPWLRTSWGRRSSIF